MVLNALEGLIGFTDCARTVQDNCILPSLDHSPVLLDILIPDLLISGSGKQGNKVFLIHQQSHVRL